MKNGCVKKLNEVTVTTTGILPGVGPAGWPPSPTMNQPLTARHSDPASFPTTDQEMSFRSPSQGAPEVCTSVVVVFFLSPMEAMDKDGGEALNWGCSRYGAWQNNEYELSNRASMIGSRR